MLHSMLELSRCLPQSEAHVGKPNEILQRAFNNKSLNRQMA
jgi:hypothetical protein